MKVQAQLEPPKEDLRRGSQRRRLSLGVSLRASGDPVIIRDFSSHGMLIESAESLPLFDRIEIDLPEAGKTSAFIVWKSGRYHGCEFTEPLSRASVSAALLRSQPKTGASPTERRTFSVVRTNESEAPQTEESIDAIDEDKAPLGVRLRVIFGSAFLLWAIIVGAVWGFARLA